MGQKVTREIQWTQTARHDLARLRAWLQLYSPDKEAQEAKRIADTTTYLQIHPRLGKRIPNLHDDHLELRELLLAPYVIRYTVDEKNVRIARLWHYREHRSSFH